MTDDTADETMTVTGETVTESGIVIPPAGYRPEPQPSPVQVNDADLAILHMRLERMGMASSLSGLQIEHLNKVGEAMAKLQAFCTPEQFALLLPMLRGQKGDLLPVIQGLIEKALNGQLFDVESPSKKQRAPKVQEYSSRKMRRARKRR